MFELCLRTNFHIFGILKDKQLSLSYSLMDLSSFVIELKVSVFMIKRQTWQFLFPHSSLPKVLLRIGNEALTKWSFKFFQLWNPTIQTLGNTFWWSLFGASRICNSSKNVLVFWNFWVIRYIKHDFIFS